MLCPTRNAGTSKASPAFWQVDDVEAEVASIATGGGAKSAWFKDTEGNIMAVSQRLSPNPR